jgi:uncharacterized protein (DUF302 family)
MQPIETELDMPFEEAVERVIIGLEQEGFAILSDIDLQSSLQQKMAAGCSEYRILGAYNLDLAYQLIQASPDSVLLPVNIVLRQDNTGHVKISLVANDALLSGHHPVNQEVQQRLQRVYSVLGGTATGAANPGPQVAGQGAGQPAGTAAAGSSGQAAPTGRMPPPETVEEPNAMNPFPGGGVP